MSFPFRIKSLSEYHEHYRRSLQNPEEYWAEVAQNFRWRTSWVRVLQGSFEEGNVKWFDGATLNITENALDRHAETQPDKIALLWEANNPGEAPRRFTYRELLQKAEQFAHILKAHGVQKGDRVCIYMGMVPELFIATLACARIGAIHSIIFGGFSAQSIADRLQDAGAKIVLTGDGAYRGAKTILLKDTVDEALKSCPFVEKVIVLRRTGQPVSMQAERDFWWEEETEKVAENTPFPAEEMQAEDPLFILYTSGSTGKPKGVVHTCGGYMVWTTYTFVNVFQPQPGDVFFCTADIGWITGHSYMIYGPLCAGSTVLMFEGVPTWPDAGRFWEIIQRHRASIFYTSPTAIRSLMTFGTALLEGKDLSSLRVLGSVGEPINEEAWHWLDEHVGKRRCPIVDTWWQTETGGVLISNLAGVTPSKPSYATLPLPGVTPVLLDEKGEELKGNEVSGNLCIKTSWPSILRTTWSDHERYRKTYFSAYPGYYFTGDGCLRDAEGFYRITGRVDDVLNVSGHRIGTAEVENVLDEHPAVVESAAVGFPHAIKGQAIYAFVVCVEKGDANVLRKEIAETVSRIIGPTAKPDKIQFVSGLPKTRSGKIMRRILRKIAEGESENIGDTSTLLDPAVVEEIRKGAV